MPLKLSLKPGEKFVLNGAVLANGDKRTSLVIQNKALYAVRAYETELGF